MIPHLWRELGLAAVELEDGDTALAALNHALDADRYDVHTLLAKAQALALLKQPEEATRLLERTQSFIPLDETEPQLALLTEQIVLLRRQRRWEELLSICEQALTLDPQLAPVWANKGSALSYFDRPAEALDACEHALAIDSKLAAAWDSDIAPG